MSEYTEVEQPFLHQLRDLGWQIIGQGPEIPADPTKSLRQNFRQWILPEVFAQAVSAINSTADGKPWLTARQLQDLQDQILRQPNRTLLEANEAVQKLLLKAQVDVNEVTGEQDPVVKLIDFANPDNNHFLAINQFRIDTPGCVKQFIILDIVLFVNGIPLIVVECKKGGPTCANPMAEAFEQLQRYMNRREETKQQGLREGEPRLFHCNLLVVRSSRVEADYGTITSGDEHFYPWKTQWPQSDTRPDETAAGMDQQAQLINGMLNKPNLLCILRTSSVFMDTDSGPRIKVVISGDGTNEAAYVTEARKQARAWNAKNNFCKPFAFDDPEKPYAGIAFLVVCDMLLTGFDAPIEQVMYVDKRLREHGLLQAIARTNRVKKGKHRGYIVDYIDLTANLTEALTLYAATEEQQELALGLRGIESEIPVLEERYQRLLQLFVQKRAGRGVEGVQDFAEAG